MLVAMMMAMAVVGTVVVVMWCAGDGGNSGLGTVESCCPVARTPPPPLYQVAIAAHLSAAPLKYRG